MEGKRREDIDDDILHSFQKNSYKNRQKMRISFIMKTRNTPSFMSRKSPHDVLPPEELAREQQKLAEQLIDHTLEDLIIGHTRRVNEGNNGVIFHLDLRDLPSQQLEELKRRGIELGEEQAVKILKVYFAGNGRREFDLQHRAYRMLKGMEEVASIPRPILYRDIKLTSQGRKELKEQGIRAEERAEILIMEFVPGIDLATLLYREALRRRYPELYPTMEDVSTMDIKTLRREIASALGFEFPGGKGATEADRAYELRRVETANAKKLCDFLRQKGFVLPPVIVERLDRTVRCLHEGGIIHRDLHERNIMLTHPSDLQRSGVYLVDFGSARDFTGSYRGQEQSLYEDPEAGVMYVQDEMALRLLETLTKSLNEEKRQAASVDAQRLLKKARDLDRDSSWVQKRNRLLSNQTSESVTEFLFNVYSSLVTTPEAVPFFLNVILTCLQEKKVTIVEARQVIDRVLTQKPSPRARNLLAQFSTVLPSLETEN